MRWFMWALGVVYLFTLSYGLHQFQLISVGLALSAAAWASGGWTVLCVGLRRWFPVLSWSALVWNGCNLIALNLLLWFYTTDVSKYLN